MVEITCPKCNCLLSVNIGDSLLQCIECETFLEIEISSPGFTLVSVADEDMQEAGRSILEALPEKDPVLIDHERWRVGSVFSMIFGAIIFYYAGYSLRVDYALHGMNLFRLENNIIFIIIAFLVGAFFISCGTLVFIMVGRETRKYMQARNSSTDL